jgi:hypothetical protein
VHYGPHELFPNNKPYVITTRSISTGEGKGKGKGKGKIHPVTCNEGT